MNHRANFGGEAAGAAEQLRRVERVRGLVVPVQIGHVEERHQVIPSSVFRNLRLKRVQARIPCGHPGDVGRHPLAMRVLAVPSA